MFPGDRVIPQFVDGGSWKTTITCLNLENHSVAFQILFFKDDGTDLYVPVIGQGLVRGMNISLNIAGSSLSKRPGPRVRYLKAGRYCRKPPTMRSES